MSVLNNRPCSAGLFVTEVVSGNTTLSEAAVENQTPSRQRPIKLLRLTQVMEMTGLRKTKIYELNADGTFPRRVKITAHSVGWVEEEVQAWLARRIENSARRSATSNVAR